MSKLNPTPLQQPLKGQLKPRHPALPPSSLQPSNPDLSRPQPPQPNLPAPLALPKLRNSSPQAQDQLRRGKVALAKMMLSAIQQSKAKGK